MCCSFTRFCYALTALIIKASFIPQQCTTGYHRIIVTVLIVAGTVVPMVIGFSAAPELAGKAVSKMVYWKSIRDYLAEKICGIRVLFLRNMGNLCFCRYCALAYPANAGLSGPFLADASEKTTGFKIMNEIFGRYLLEGQRAGIRYGIAIPHTISAGAFLEMSFPTVPAALLNLWTTREYVVGDDLRRIDWSAFCPAATNSQSSFSVMRSILTWT